MEMKIDDMINKLNLLRKEHGNISVCITNEDYDIFQIRHIDTCKYGDQSMGHPDDPSYDETVVTIQ